ncbi:MAG: hypothetical protein ABA06_04580 [Parcubacteria bacterium C7867-001]|nr:MAG: hypothetical protein ABA06_04580 [Parcubacteria bacterium C7867-001]
MKNSLQGSVVLDHTGKTWERTVEHMLATCKHIVALRGAGSFNGISTADANLILEKDLIPRLETYIEDGPTSVIFDGDNDDPEYPDIGHIMGRLCDHFGDRADFYAVQMLGWYKYRNELPAMRPLHSANGNEYQTVLFPDKTFVGDHDHFSQDTCLAKSCGYEQWYVGACGQIASKQLADYSDKAWTEGPHRALIFRAPVSVEQERKIRRKLAEETDPERRTRLCNSLAQREQNPFGLLCTPDGTFISKPEYKSLLIEVI